MFFLPPISQFSPQKIVLLQPMDPYLHLVFAFLIGFDEANENVCVFIWIYSLDQLCNDDELEY
jgi:hypothetical protein